METAPMSRIGFRLLRSALDMFRDCRGVAAIEFAFIVPVMLVMFFGVVEFSSGVAVDRKVTLVARTTSDLTSQAPSAAPQSPYAAVTDTDFQNAFNAGVLIFKPYPPTTPATITVSEIYVDSNAVAKIQWSRAATITSTAATLTASSRSPGDTVTSLVPPALLLSKQTYLIYSEVSFLYQPAVGYGLMPAGGVTLRDVAFSRPRQVFCITYNNLPALVSGQCPST